MRLIVVGIAIFLLASPFNGQGQTIDLSGKKIPLKQVFSSIKKQTGFVFFYDAALVKEAKPVTIDLKNASLDEALKQIFKDQPYDWVVENKTITIIEKPIPSPSSQQLSLPIQRTKITGTVKDHEGNPIHGASVMVKGTGRGTTTNENGSFLIEAYSGNVLVISSVSYIEKQVIVESKSISIQLELDFKPMESLIVGGNIMPVKRKAEVSSVAVIDSKTLESLPNQNIEQIYRGLVPGMNNIQSGYETSQYTYASGSVSIRGSSGFAGYGVVKVYVDGIEYAVGSYFLNSMDKNNIDHIEIVKGPSASTLYGSGANGGVILVYTKRASPNTTNIDLSTSAGWYDSKWQDKKPFRQIHSFNVAQGFENISYFIAGDINNNETYMPDGRQNRYSISGSVTYAKDNLKMSIAGQHYDNSYLPERNAFWDTSSNAYFNKPGLKLPDTARGMNKTNVLSVNINYKLNKWWTHDLVFGWSDNYQGKESFLKNPTTLQSEFKWKGPSLRYYNTINIKSRTQIKASLLTGIEYSNITSGYFAVTRSGAVLTTTRNDTADLQKNTGVFAQLSPSYKDKLFLILSGRYEFNKTFGNIFNPRIGVTTNFQFGELILKPRIAWGKGITPPAWGERYPSAPFLANPDLKPQNQSGWDYGLEGYMEKGDLVFEISRYDYILENGITPSVTTSLSGPSIRQYVNAGKLSNNGWEFSASYKFKSFNISGNYSIINSILKEPLTGKPSEKDLIWPGEQMQFIPKNAGGIMIGYDFPKLFSHSDRLSLAAHLTYTSGAPSVDYVAYTYDAGVWRYPGNFINYGPRYYKTHLSASSKVNLNLEYDIHNGFRFFMQASNLTNNTIPEYISTFPSIGRGWMFGLKYGFTKASN